MLFLMPLITPKIRKTSNAKVDRPAQDEVEK
jgi:hypothetical protein